MADHYGSAEEIAGHFLANAGRGRARAVHEVVPRAWTDDARDRARGRRDAASGASHSSAFDLMQFHWWRYSHPGYIDALSEMARMRAEGRIGHLGVTNFDTDHLRLLVRHGIPIVSNQVSFSLLDRRAAGRMSDFCRASGVKLLAYGTLAGGFLTDHWVGRTEPQQIPDWSKSKYKHFIDAIGGWGVLQEILSAAKRIADKHRVSVANVAARWVLEHEAVAAVIIGARLGEREHRTTTSRSFPSRSMPKTRRGLRTHSRRRATCRGIAGTSTASRRS
jgi:aryl-alcohol dehydrogenase-like predicted oxidoreductase